MMKLGSILHATQALLLDFDGPICSVFAGYPAPAVAQTLRQTLQSFGVTGPIMNGRTGPLTLLRWVADNHPELVNVAEDLLITAEREAVRTAAPTHGADTVIVAAGRIGRPIAIVSNNSAIAIREYLDGRKLDVAAIVGRPYADPTRMKPNPEMVTCAIKALGVSPRDCVFIGDATTDIEAAISAGVHSIAYAKSPERISALVDAGAEVVVDSMAVIAETLEKE